MPLDQVSCNMIPQTIINISSESLQNYFCVFFQSPYKSYFHLICVIFKAFSKMCQQIEVKQINTGNRIMYSAISTYNAKIFGFTFISLTLQIKMSHS